MNVQQMNYAAICDCGVVRASMPVDYRKAKEMGKQVKSWIRDGYTIKYVSDSYIKHHKKPCKCAEVAEAVRR